MNAYVNSNATEKELHDARYGDKDHPGGLDGSLKAAGWDQARRDDFFKKLDEMRADKLSFPADMKLPWGKDEKNKGMDTDRTLDQAWVL